MLDFHKPIIEDKAWVDECLSHISSMNCEYSFGNLFAWSAAYKTEICHYKDFLITRWYGDYGFSYSLPLGVGDFTDAVNQIIEDAKSNGSKPRIYGITSAFLPMLQEAFMGKFIYEYDEGYNDYIYSVEKMASLSGKKYHGKRNHISNFKKSNPSWSFEEINKNNIGDCITFHKSWIEGRDVDDEEYSFEFDAALRCFDNYDELGMVGGLIRVDDRVVAYTMGEPQKNGKCFVTHFEKADPYLQGAYPIINQEFTKGCLLDYEYVNREEDLGLEGLRKAKRSYYPEILLEKCVAIYND